MLAAVSWPEDRDRVRIRREIATTVSSPYRTQTRQKRSMYKSPKGGSNLVDDFGVRFEWNPVRTRHGEVKGVVLILVRVRTILDGVVLSLRSASCDQICDRRDLVVASHGNDVRRVRQNEAESKMEEAFCRNSARRRRFDRFVHVSHLLESSHVRRDVHGANQAYFVMSFEYFEIF